METKPSSKKRRLSSPSSFHGVATRTRSRTFLQYGLSGVSQPDLSRRQKLVSDTQIRRSGSSPEKTHHTSIKDLRSRRIFSPASLPTNSFSRVKENTEIDSDVTKPRVSGAADLEINGEIFDQNRKNEIPRRSVGLFQEGFKRVSVSDEYTVFYESPNVGRDEADSDVGFSHHENEEMFLQESDINCKSESEKVRENAGSNWLGPTHEVENPLASRVSSDNSTDKGFEKTMKKALIPCSRMKVFRTPNSFSYQRLLPFLTDLAKDNSGEIDSRKNCSSIKLDKDEEERPKLPLLDSLSPESCVVYGKTCDSGSCDCPSKKCFQEIPHESKGFGESTHGIDIARPKLECIGSGAANIDVNFGNQEERKENLTSDNSLGEQCFLETPPDNDVIQKVSVEELARSTDMAGIDLLGATGQDEEHLLTARASVDNLCSTREGVDSPKKEDCYKKKPYLMPCSRRKVFCTTNSLSYRRLLPYLMNLSKDDTKSQSCKNYPPVEAKRNDTERPKLPLLDSACHESFGRKVDHLPLQHCPGEEWFQRVPHDTKILFCETRKGSDTTEPELPSIGMDRADMGVQFCRQQEKRSNFPTTSSHESCVKMDHLPLQHCPGEGCFQGVPHDTKICCKSRNESYIKDPELPSVLVEEANMDVEFSLQKDESSNLPSAHYQSEQLFQTAISDSSGIIRKSTAEDDSGGGTERNGLVGLTNYHELENPFSTSTYVDDLSSTQEDFDYLEKEEKVNTSEVKFCHEQEKKENLPAFDSSDEEWFQMTLPDSDIICKSAAKKVERNMTMAGLSLLGTTLKEEEENPSTARVSVDEHCSTIEEVDTLEKEGKDTTVCKNRPHLIPCTRVKLFRTSDSVSYRRLLPFLMNLTKENASSLEIHSCKNYNPVKIEKNEEARSKLPLLDFVSGKVDPIGLKEYVGLETYTSGSMIAGTLISEFPNPNSREKPITESPNTRPLENATLCFNNQPAVASLASSFEVNSSQVHQIISDNSSDHAMDVPSNSQSSHLSHEALKYQSPSKLSQKEVKENHILLESHVPGPTKSILKKTPQRCRGFCACPSCSSFRLSAEKSCEFSRKQMQDTEEVVTELLKELSTLRSVTEKSIDATIDGSNDHFVQLNQIKAVCVRAEELARNRLRQMTQDLNIHCKITRLQQPRVAFSDKVEEKLIPLFKTG